MKTNFNTSTRIVLFTALFTLLFAGPAAFAAKVYKWVDKEGNVHYGAQQPEGSGGAQEMDIKVKASSRAEETESTDKADSGKSSDNDAKEEKVKVSNEKEAEEIEKKNAEIRERNCSVAKKRLASINAGGRLYEVDEKGERSFWDESTTASKRAEAEAQVAEWCQ